MQTRLTPTGSHLIEVEGLLDLETSPILQAALVDLLARGADRIALDLSRLVFLDSAGMAVLLSARNQARATGGSLALACPNDTVLRILRRTGVARVISVHETVERALEEVSARAG